MTVMIQLEAIFRFHFQDDEITLTAATTADEVDGWDSLSHVGLILAIEKSFGIRFSTTDIAVMENVGILERIVRERVAKV